MGWLTRDYCQWLFDGFRLPGGQTRHEEIEAIMVIQVVVFPEIRGMVIDLETYK